MKNNMDYRDIIKPTSKYSIDMVKNHSFNLDSSLEHIAHWLPSQGPIKDFIHHNTLHAVQEHPFHEGIAIAAKIFGARSYLPLEDYQKMYQQGRIRQSAIDWAIEHSGVNQLEQDKLRETLFVQNTSSHYPPPSLVHQGIRNTWLTQIEVDLNSMAHPILFRLLSNFLDQGISSWVLPKDNECFWDCILRISNNSFLPLYPLNEPLVHALLSETSDHVIKICLEKIVGDETLYEQYLLELVLAHPGWSGMVKIIESNPQSLLAHRQISLKQMIAVELAIELAFLLKKKGHHFTNIASIPYKKGTPLFKDNKKPIIPLHLKTWHEAMEWSLHTELLFALKPKNGQNSPATNRIIPEAQALFCIDDRECSLRRHLEEINPAIETFGAAGFFGIDFLYQGLDDAYPVAQCPNIITPKNLIKESSSTTNTSKDKAKPSTLTHMHFTSHSMLRGWLYTQTLGIGYAIKMAWDVFRPGSKLLNIKLLSEVKPHSQLHLLRDSEELSEDGYLLGFSFIEMADRLTGLLRNIGLTQDFAPLVVVVAHGSSSVNNPHFAAYDCGACSGKPGAPNARAFAWMANHESVRTILRERGIDIPDSTRFIAALHNTSKDEITYFDSHLLELHPIAGLHAFQQTMSKALLRNARERCRWFELAPQSQSNDIAHKHVIKRASSIFEPRPEYNHSNNLYCIVGRRKLTRDLFLDRRAFLHSYDPQTDKLGEIMVRILSAVIPVCGGINLEYLFSRIDNSVYGAGTKLPHNVIGLLGVANGVDGDLRTGLPSQMIEVHQPARLLIVAEQTTDILDKTIANLGPLKEWLDNEWVRFVSCHPLSHQLSLYSASGWEVIENLDEYTTPQATHSEQILVGQKETIPVHHLIREQA
ncbi:MAG: YbcC family protein [Methylococcales bacterium]